MRRLITATSALVALAALLSACSSSPVAAKDVTITACTAGATGGHPTVSGRILNHSSKASLYAIHVKFTDAAGNGAGDGLAAVARVEAGATANWHATGTVDAKGHVTCKLSSVTRHLSP
jgi:tripartite-type tricarboxylate transporter receptor subunit TctC